MFSVILFNVLLSSSSLMLAIISQLPTTVDAKCSYSFVVNEVDPSSCPCLLEQPSNVGQAKPWQPPATVNVENQLHDEKNQIFGPHKEGQDSLFQQKAAKPDSVKPGYLNKIEGGEQLKYEFNRLMSTMKELEIRVYQESVQNRELKNIVIKQEQVVKDYKYLVEKLKHSMTKHKVGLIRDKESIMDEMIVLKQSVDDMKETQSKQDYYLKTLQKSTHDLRLQLNPDSDLPNKDPLTEPSKTKVIPVQATSNVICNGLSVNATKYKDCDELYQRGHKESGVYYVKPSFTPCPIPVYCDMGRNGTGWLVFQRRVDGKEDFNRNWNEYRDGFGDLNHEFWLGNNNIFLFTNQASYRLRIDMWDFNNTHKYAEYLYFLVSGERDKYRLLLFNHTGTVKDGLYRHNGMMFSTKDEDNDSWKDYHCGKEWSGGWWFNNCWFVILNGKYYESPKVKFRGISWNDWKTEQLKKVEMKISPSDYK